jgi:hypothetical protein
MKALIWIFYEFYIYHGRYAFPVKFLSPISLIKPFSQRSLEITGFGDRMTRLPTGVMHSASKQDFNSNFNRGTPVHLWLKEEITEDSYFLNSFSSSKDLHLLRNH